MAKTKQEPFDLWVVSTLLDDRITVEKYRATHASDKAATVIVHGAKKRLSISYYTRWFVDVASLKAWYKNWVDQQIEKVSARLAALQDLRNSDTLDYSVVDPEPFKIPNIPIKF